MLAALAFGVTADAGAGKRKPAIGDYQGSLDSPPGNYTFAQFTVAKSERKRVIVPTPEFGAIFYPDANECERFAAPLVAESIPINRKRAFRIRERTQADDGDLVVTWTGRWTRPRSVTGRIVIRYGDCVSKLRWTGGPA